MIRLGMLLIAVWFAFCGQAQSVGIGTNQPSSSAQLDISSSSKGLLPPRMSTVQRDGIVAPEAGLMIYNTTTACIEIYRGSHWFNLCTSAISPTAPVTDIDGNNYPVVTIGSQVWMAKNLATTHFSNGDAIAYAPLDLQWSSNFSGAFCQLNNDTANFDIYGRLYNFYAVAKGNLCPIGWHVPNDAEWTVLTSFLGGTAQAGGKLKETGLTHWASPNTGANNSSGFTALPGGNRGQTGNFNFGNAFWWTSNEFGAGNAFARMVKFDAATVTRFDTFKQVGLSVRCAKN